MRQAATAVPADSSSCPCGSGAAYAACCGRWHGGPAHLQAPSAEALMRSRYCAYVMGLNDYLLATWHPSTRPAGLAPAEPGLRWLGLQVRSHQMQGEDAATVEFVARSKLGGRAHRLQETSRFVREDGRWRYVDGHLSLPAATCAPRGAGDVSASPADAAPDRAAGRPGRPGFPAP